MLDFEIVSDEFNRIIADYEEMLVRFKNLYQTRNSSGLLQCDEYLDNCKHGTARERHLYRCANLSAIIDCNLGKHIELQQANNVRGFRVIPIIPENRQHISDINGFSNIISDMLWHLASNYELSAHMVKIKANQELNRIKKEYLDIVRNIPLDASYSYVDHMREIHEYLSMNMLDINPIELLQVDVSKDMYITVSYVCPEPPYPFYNLVINTGCWRIYNSCIKSIESEIKYRVYQSKKMLSMYDS
jgi:hypothetical protein